MRRVFLLVICCIVYFVSNGQDISLKKFITFPYKDLDSLEQTLILKGWQFAGTFKDTDYVDTTFYVETKYAYGSSGNQKMATAWILIFQLATKNGVALPIIDHVSYQYANDNTYKQYMGAIGLLGFKLDKTYRDETYNVKRYRKKNDAFTVIVERDNKYDGLSYRYYIDHNYYSKWILKAAVKTDYLDK